MIYLPKRKKPKAKPWGTNQKLYSSRKWRKAREEYLSEHPQCNVVGCNRIATVVDHIIPIRQGGDIWNRNNWQGLCKKHHNSKTAKESNGEY